MNSYEHFSDEEIVLKVRSDNQELYAVLVERYQGKLLRYARSLIGDERTAVDAVQESFLKAFINLRGFDVEKKFSSWIYRIVHNEAMNLVKKYPRETPLFDDIDIPSDEDIADNLEQQELSVLVRQCLNQIPLLYSEPLVLRYIEDKSYEEIGDILRLPMGTVATRMSRAKKLMKHVCLKNKTI